MTHLIDCHILTLPGTEPPAWADELRADLAGEPVNQHWMLGIHGQLGAARAEGLARGKAPFVTWANPDDRIQPGTYAALLEALQANPCAPFAWAGEQRVNADLAPMGPPSVPRAYNARNHRNNLVNHVRGVVLIRRSAVAHLLGPGSVLRHAGRLADAVLLGHLGMAQEHMPDEGQPVPVPMVGRLWRQHEGNCASTVADLHDAQRLLNVKPQYLHNESPKIVPCASCGTSYKGGA